jgi:ESCRT-II complex subunit VPS22
MAHRRRGVGVGRSSGAPTSSQHHPTSLVQKKVDEMKAVSLQSAIQTLEQLEIKLTQFAQQHQNEIKNDPVFRHRFLQMCAPLGVDVLSTSKQNAKSNIFHSIFGNNNNNANANAHANTPSMTDFYYELAVKCAEVCLATQNRNGGIMSIGEIQSILQQRKTKYGMRAASQSTVQVSTSDIQIAIEKLGTLGGGFRTVLVGDTTMVISVPTELDNDHMQILTIATQEQEQNNIGSSGGGQDGLTMEHIMSRTKWTHSRATRAMDLLVQEGMAWIDIHQGMTYYWFTSIWQQQQQKRPVE